VYGPEAYLGLHTWSGLASHTTASLPRVRPLGTPTSTRGTKVNR
jgi:hypothetical protein